MASTAAKAVAPSEEPPKSNSPTPEIINPNNLPAHITAKESKHPRLDPLLPGASHQQLRIGDTISLVVQRDDKLCFIGSEGFVELGSSLREYDLSQPVPWTHVECLWIVCTKHQYDARKSLHKANKARQEKHDNNSLPALKGGGNAAAAFEASGFKAPTTRRCSTDGQRHGQTHGDALKGGARGEGGGAEGARGARRRRKGGEGLERRAQ